MITPKLGPRLKALREARKLSQADIAAMFEFNDRQTVSDIEVGKRRLSGVELLKAVAFFGVSLDELTNPFLLASGGAAFSWRQSGVPAADLNRFEVRAGEWIGAYRELTNLNGDRLPTILPRLGLTYKSPYSDAVRAGEGVAIDFDLGNAPARRLAEVMEEKLGILVLMVDAINGVSGAACRLPELNVVLINRHESEARRHFDLAHELFHLLTWDTMSPARVEDAEAPKGDEAPKSQAQRRYVSIERLANNFASGVLMPSLALDRLGDPHGDIVVWLGAAASELGVSSLALKYRMKNDGRLPEADKIPDPVLTKAARDRFSCAPVPPPLFGRAFIQVVATAINGGHLSARRAAALVDLSIEELGDLCAELGVDRPAEI